MLPEKDRFHNLADRVKRRHMGFLDMRGLVGLGDKAEVDGVFENAAILPGKTQRPDLLLFCLSDRFQDIRLTAARGKDH